MFSEGLSWKTQLIAYQPLETAMDSELAAFTHADSVGASNCSFQDYSNG
jgi:hypothetical protein